MKKSYLTNLLLLALIIGLYWFNTADTDKPMVNEMPKLTGLNSNDIHSITISRPNTTDIVLEKSTVGWQITQPIKAVANTIRVELLLSFLNTPSYGQIIVTKPNELTQFELAPANLVLTLDKLNVKFGGIEPISQHRYVLLNNEVHLITDRITPLLHANAASFIENRLIAKDMLITKLVLPQLNSANTISAESVTIENSNGHWQSNLSAIKTDQLTALVQNWQHAYALQVLPQKESTAPSTPTHKVQIWFNNQPSPTEYELTVSDNALFITDSKQQLNYQFTLASIAQLLPLQPIKK
ncbi:hypothetical protein LCGC14_0887860 [marine sediment metagenome]|uniref:DUF4340 domain-containing protein n=1 Tax=marine sediment metagenome TaxID=412755 RepID=A0A0F9PKT6_9ZZZZ|nr:DUF4340 domain-containing protein [Methylophaga sp.]